MSTRIYLNQGVQDMGLGFSMIFKKEETLFLPKNEKIKSPQDQSELQENITTRKHSCNLFRTTQKVELGSNLEPPPFQLWKSSKTGQTKDLTFCNGNRSNFLAAMTRHIDFDPWQLGNF